LADDRTAAFSLCVAVSTIAPVCHVIYQGTVSSVHMTVFSDRQFTVCGMLLVLCELEFSEFAFNITFIELEVSSPTKLFIICLHVYSLFLRKNPINIVDY